MLGGQEQTHSKNLYGYEMTVLSSQVFIRNANCEFVCQVILQAFMDQRLVSMFLTRFLVIADGLADTDEHCSYLSQFEPVAYFNFICSKAFA